MVTIKDVAKQANVSIATVSHVINGTRFVTEETKARVRKVMKDLHYERNLLGVTFRKQRSRTIGMVVPFLPQFESSNQFYLWVMLGAESVLTKEKFSILLSNSEESLQVESNVMDRLKRLQVEGVILAAPAVDQQRVIEQLDGISVVFIDREPVGLSDSCDVVLSDSRKAIYDAVTEQIRRGRKKFGIVNGNVTRLSNVRLRYEGFLQALQDNGIPCDRSYAVDEIPSADHGYSITEKLFNQHPDLDSVFVTMNGLGSGALQYIRDSGRKVPEDVNITVFDDALWNRVSTPSLTTITQDPQRIGSLAAHVLLDKLESGSHVPEKHLVETKLIIRNSWN
jgi:LacI family transcriptional regulator